jgi:hypothetical protein
LKAVSTICQKDSSTTVANVMHIRGVLGGYCQSFSVEICISFKTHVKHRSKATSETNEVKLIITKAMTTNREIAATITRGRNFFRELIPMIESGVVTKIGLETVCAKHHIHSLVLSSFLLTGMMIACDMSKYSNNGEYATTIEADIHYLVYFTVPIDDSLCFNTVLASSYAEKNEAYTKFCKSYPRDIHKHCLRCQLVLPSSNTSEFCSDRCQELHSIHNAHKPEKLNGIKTSIEQLMQSFRDFFSIR